MSSSGRVYEALNPERFLAAVAAYRAAANVGKGYVIVDVFYARPYAVEGEAKSGRPIQRLVVTRVYAGKHKSLETSQTVLVGYDLDEDRPVLMAIACSDRYAYELHVRSAALGTHDAPFEGVFDLRNIDIPG